MSILHLPHAAPKVMLFDWHATLVNTHDAMYHAIDDVLPKLRELDLWDRLLLPENSKTIDDAKLLIYVREHQRLHPKIISQRKISRTDIFEVLFGSDQDAKGRAHAAFDDAYQRHVEDVTPLEPDVRPRLTALRDMGIKLGLLSNRRRDFLQHELAKVDGQGWLDLFDVVVSGSDVENRKPAPDMLLSALDQLGCNADRRSWYLGDSTTDVIAAKTAGITSVFYNGAKWPQSWLDKIFPGTVTHPHQPDAVITALQELEDMSRWFIAQQQRIASGSTAD